MSASLKGKVAIVTGSGQGIGRVVALAMAKEGAKVVTNNRKPDSTGFAIVNDSLIHSLSEEKQEWLRREAAAAKGDAETTAKAIRDSGGEAVSFFGDVSNYEIARQLIQKAVDNFGKIDILVNVAGTFAFCPVWEATEEIWDHVNIKPKAHFNCIRHALPFMMQQNWGRIINCASGDFRGVGIRESCYTAANAAVIGLTGAIAQELYPYGITCNAFAPNARTRASFELAAYEMANPADHGPWVDNNFKLPLANSPSAEDIGPFICYLATEEAAGISGSLFYIGGKTVGLYAEAELKSTLTKYGGRWTIEELKEQVPRALLSGYRSPAVLVSRNPAK